jgi:3-dehydroquinate synthase
VERHRAAFSRVGLPTTYDAPFDDLHEAMKVDKKARGSQLRFVVLDDLAVPRILAGPGEDDLRAAYAAIGGES